MKTLPLGASDEEVLDAVREWVGFLVEERYADAYEFLYHGNTVWHWTPEIIATLIRYYGSLEPIEEGDCFKVSSLEEARKNSPDYPEPCRVHRYQDDKERFVWEMKEGEMIQRPIERNPQSTCSGHVWFDLPINGYWSDLTAILTFRSINDHIVFGLESIHVM